MSTLEHEREIVADFSLRVAMAKGPMQLSLLWTEIEFANLNPDQKGALQDLIVARFDGKRAQAAKISNGNGAPSDKPAVAQPTTVDTSASPVAVGLSLAAFHEQISAATRVTDISWLINELPNVDASAAQRVEAMRRMILKREELITGTAAPCE